MYISGLYCSVYRVADNIAELVAVFQKAFDNEATPYFGLIMCLWGKLWMTNTVLLPQFNTIDKM